MTFLVNDSIPRRRLGTGEEFPVRVVEGAVCYPLEDLVVAQLGGYWSRIGPDGRPTCAGGAHDFLLSHLHFYCNLLIARYGACAVILISAPYGHVVLLFLRQLPGDCSHINFV